MSSKIVNLSERISVTGTGKDAKNFPEGKERKVHPMLAEKLIAAGVVKKTGKAKE